MEANKKAGRILTGTGSGLLLATALAMISGVITANYSLTTLMPLASILILGIGLMTSNGIGPLIKLFPAENTEQQMNRIEKDIEEIEKENNLSGAWAKLEASVLKQNLGEE